MKSYEELTKSIRQVTSSQLPEMELTDILKVPSTDCLATIGKTSKSELKTVLISYGIRVHASIYETCYMLNNGLDNWVEPIVENPEAIIGLAIWHIDGKKLHFDHLLPSKEESL